MQFFLFYVSDLKLFTNFVSFIRFSLETLLVRMLHFFKHNFIVKRTDSTRRVTTVSTLPASLFFICIIFICFKIFHGHDRS